MSGRLLFIVNDSAFFVSHRLALAIAAKQAGYEVIVATGGGQCRDEITCAGLKYIRLPLSRGGMNPLAEARLLYSMVSLYWSVRPDLVHLVTIKPVLYGGILARLLRVPGVVAAISGMGYLFTDDHRSLVRYMVQGLYRFALGHRNSRIIFQNNSDKAALQDLGALRPGYDVLIPGSGVDLSVFTPAPLPEGVPLVVLPARMLRDKGVVEFIEAAQILRNRGVPWRFVLVGPADPDNPTAVPLVQLEAFQKDSVIEWWGYCDDMPSVFADASLVVLPSYREGMPKALLEAAAAGRAIVTTDAPGCRDVVEPEKNGLLVPVKEPEALASAIEQLLTDRERLVEMGRNSRKKAEDEFGIERVVEAHLHIYKILMDAI